MEHPTTREDPAELEKDIQSDSFAVPFPKTEVEHAEGKIILSEAEAYERARAHPEEKKPLYVNFAPNEVDNPRNWTKAKKWYVTCFVCLLNILTCLCAGGYSSGVGQITTEFGASAELGTLGLSMYILGFAFGPMLLAPLSEYYGRNPVYIGSWFFLVLFQIPVALAPNMATVIVCRLFQGFGGSAPLTNTGGTVSDLWERNSSGPAMSIYGLSSTFGPPLALILSGYLAQDEGWRVMFWAFMGITGGMWLIMLATLPETRHSTILTRKAEKLRKKLRSEGLPWEMIRDVHADEPRSLHFLFAVNLTRPFRFLFSEPITACAAAYNGFIYGIVYIFNGSFSQIFGPGGHNFTTGQQGLSFTGIAVGSLIGVAIYPLQERYYLRRVASGDKDNLPEARLWMARFGAFLLPVSLFWFAWTSFPTLPFIIPIIASVFFGLGIYIVILSILNYVVDSYQTYSASALAGVILVRNVVGACFPLFGSQMYARLGNEWATSLLAFVAIAFVPIPWLWFYRGRALRESSPFAREHVGTDEDVPH